MANEQVNTVTPDQYVITNQRTNRVGVSKVMTYLLIGGGIGAVVALLFSPKCGRELRGDIADMLRGDDCSNEAALQLEAGATRYYEAERESASQLYAAAAKQADSLASAARESASSNGGFGLHNVGQHELS